MKKLTKQDIETDIFKILKNKLTSEITLDKKVIDFEIDLLDAVEIVMDIEDKYDIEIADEIIDNFNNFTVKDIINYLVERFEIKN